MGLISYHGDESLKKSTISSKLPILEPKFLEESLGIPAWIYEIKNLFFFMFTKEDSDDFDMKLLKAIPVGVNLERVKWKFLSYILEQCIPMLSVQTGDERFSKERDEFIPHLEKTKNSFDRLYMYEIEDKDLMNFSMISRTLDVSLPRGLQAEDYLEIYKKFANELIEILRKEKTELLFKFNSIKIEKNILEKKASNEYEPLLGPETKKHFKYLRSFIKRFI
jgi:hypothetical protein